VAAITLLFVLDTCISALNGAWNNVAFNSAILSQWRCRWG